MQKYRTYLSELAPDPAHVQGGDSTPVDVYLASEVDAEHSELIAHNAEAHARIAELEKAAAEYFRVADAFIRDRLRDDPEYDNAALALGELLPRNLRPFS